MKNLLTISPKFLLNQPHLASQIISEFNKNIPCHLQLSAELGAFQRLPKFCWLSFGGRLAQYCCSGVHKARRTSWVRLFALRSSLRTLSSVWAEIGGFWFYCRTSHILFMASSFSFQWAQFSRLRPWHSTWSRIPRFGEASDLCSTFKVVEADQKTA